MISSILTGSPGGTKIPEYSVYMANPLSGRVSFSFCSFSCAADNPKRQNVAIMNVIKLARTKLACLMFSSLDFFVV
jgi:hypothetical protein